jgi:malate dehydrogenase (oxaloacetate-decarboxylating)
MVAEPTLYDPSDAPEAGPALTVHRGGKIEMRPTVDLRGPSDLSLAYTPGVAHACAAIAAHPELSHELTWKANTIAVVTDGSAVLGLGDIGPEAALPLMEGKALVFKELGGVDAVPICLSCGNADEIVDTVTRLAPGFGGIALADISAPEFFEVRRRAQQRLNIPVFHDDQDGSAVAVAAALVNATRLTGRTIAETTVVVSGAGSAAVAVTQTLLAMGVADVVVCDSRGIVHLGRHDLTPLQVELAVPTNLACRRGDVADALEGADVFVGAPGGAIPAAALAAMAADAIVFALSTPGPDVPPDVAWQHAAIVATGRSDFANQISGVLALPGIVRGALDVQATMMSEGMRLAAAQAIADLVGDDLSPEYIVPSVFDRRVAQTVAGAVAHAAREDGVARG